MPEEPTPSKPLAEQEAGNVPSEEEPKIGVYVCQCGGNISDVVQCDRVAKAMEKLPNVTVAHSYMFMCSDPGQELIAEDIKEKGINRVVIGACSPFLHETTFRNTVERAGLNPYLYYHIGLREQDSWAHHSTPEAATEKAIRMMSAGVAKARLMRPLEKTQLDARQHALVIGGGLSGLRAALDLARCNLKVTLVEKGHFLGGHVAQWEHVFPTDEDARTLLHTLIEKVLAEPNITIHTGAEVVAAKGYVGNFQVTIRQQPRGVRNTFDNVDAAIAACPVEVPNAFDFGLSQRKAIYRPYAGCVPAGPVIDWEHCTKCGACLKLAPDGAIDLDAKPQEFDIAVGAVVMATGFQPYDPPVGEFGYGEFPEVVTLPQLERLLSPDGPGNGDLDKLEWNGHPIRSIAMIHCVGSRQIEGLHQPQPDGQVNDYCSRVCCTATLNAANHIREKFSSIQIYDVYQDIRTYGRGHEEYYRRAGENRVTFLRYLPEELPEVQRAAPGNERALLVKVKDHLTWGEEIELPVDLVVLAVGMMPSPVQDLIDMFKIAQGHDRFLLEVHPKLRPVETAVTGIVLAGTAQGPMAIQESSAAAQAAASKVDVLLRKGHVEMEPYVAHVDLERCTGSGECVTYCPQEDAVHLKTFTENGETYQRAVVTPANCNGCGVCVAVCPNRAIDVQGWRLAEFEAMVDAITAELPVVEG